MTLASVRFLAALPFFVSCVHVSPRASIEDLPPRREGAQSSNIIEFRSPVDDDSVTEFTTKLTDHILAGDTKIIVEINTPGGSVGHGFDMGHAIERAPVPVVCVVDGMAASMGLYILQSCDVRIMTTRSLLMGHAPSAGTRGQSEELSKLAHILRQLSIAMANHITRKTVMTAGEYLGKIANGQELWLTSTEALDLRFVDFTVGDVQEVTESLQ